MRKTLITAAIVCSSHHEIASAQRNAALAPIVKLLIGGCRGSHPTRMQTGFRIRGQPGIVTALHGVVGCTTINATDNTDTVADWKVTNGSINRDIAILTTTTLVTDGGLEIGDRENSLHVEGYPYGMLRPLTSKLTLRQPETVMLDYILPADSREMLHARSSPRPDITVLSLEGHLTFGHSGAPILNASRKVVGVASGGVASGAVEISWAIPLDVRVLRDMSAPLPQSELDRLISLTSDDLFAYQDAVAPAQRIACFGRDFLPVTSHALRQ